MQTLFVSIYNYLAKRKTLLYSLLIAISAVLAALAAHIRLDENISGFFPKTDADTDYAMKHMKAMDKVMVTVSMPDSAEADIYRLIDAAEAYADTLQPLLGDAATIALYHDDSQADEVMRYVLDNLPMLLTADDYQQLEQATSPEAIAERMKLNHDMMLSPLSTGIARILPFDPIGLSTAPLQRLRSLAENSSLNMIDGYIIDPERRNLLMFINMAADFGKTGNNNAIVSHIRNAALAVGEAHNVKMYVYGAPIVAVSNSQQVKTDETISLSIAITVLAIVITLTFRRKRAMLLIIMPVVFGAIFALAIISVLGLQLSLIAVGASATVLGVAMSYSIHMVTHSLHAHSIEDIVSDMSYPMTIGSITTIGAFVGLAFTESKILHDLGLFSSFALLGTILFCLIFLPHFLSPAANDKRSATLRLIEKLSGYDYSRNRWLVAILCILTAVSLFTFNDVKFNSDMTKLNYDGDEWINQSKTVTEKMLGVDGHNTTVVVMAGSADGLASYGTRLAAKADSMRPMGVMGHSSIVPLLLVPTDEQQQRIARWNQFWTADRRATVAATLHRCAQEHHFADDAFEPFEQKINRAYSPTQPSDSAIAASPILSEWISKTDSTYMLYFNLTTEIENRDHILEAIDRLDHVAVTDMGYFVRKTTVDIVDDFNTILLISSILVGAVLLLSYGRFELFAMTFLPMCVSWVIILGLMALLGVEFNVVNIILSTFIFGVGDDFSIFIMDGLQTEYRTGRKMLNSHKTAIALSAFAIVVGLGVQSFAQHPAVKSMGLISIFGLVAVIITSYIVQPILFRVFISSPAKRGEPWTLLAMLRAAVWYLTFVAGCVVVNALMVITLVMPLRRGAKQNIVRTCTWAFMRGFYWIIERTYPVVNIGKVDFSRPSVIVANHVSFIDIIAIMAMSKHTVFVTKTWVASSPLFGHIVRFCGCYNADLDNSNITAELKSHVEHGRSIVIFPEGTRSTDGQIHRFHKGAFLIAEQLGLDITPIVFYGNGLVVSKTQPLLIKRADIVNKVLPRISPDDTTYGTTYAERSKGVAALLRNELKLLQATYGDTSNPHFAAAIAKNFTYKGPQLEWYIRIKLRLEHNYRTFNELIPANATITDIGCGYGPMDFMLALVHNERRILGIDYDADKIAVANASFLAQRINSQGGNLRFEAADATQYSMPASDVFVISDMLHYISHQQQEALLAQCLSKLNAGGMIIIRDGNADSARRHKWTKLTEIFSTKVCRFNKAGGELHFTSTQRLTDFAERNGLSLQTISDSSNTSNTLYIMRL